MAGEWRAQLRAIANKRAASIRTGEAPDLGMISNQIYTHLLDAISTADMPPAAKALVAAAVQPPVLLNEQNAVIHINSVMRPSMFNRGDMGKISERNGGVFHSKYGGVDLVLVYNYRKAPKETYFPAGINRATSKSKGKERRDQKVIWAKMNGDQIQAYSNHYLESTVQFGNSLHPDVIVELRM